ncbi:hypothetical protein K7X08_020309 [Anisodus acutangulus]|uniref:Uncharacterized protein n=1 Tax=Anisodus acutangulus TaxID=402998 RepID=A0A9Q1M6U1_9SOLA|nr:hypothetical protein K7X08_020309 [Anisodus acutangulus]
MDPRKITDDNQSQFNPELQERYEDLVAQQLDLQNTMETRHQELHDDFNKRQSKLFQLVNALKGTLDGLQLQHNLRSNPASSNGNGREQNLQSGQGPNPVNVANARRPVFESAQARTSGYSPKPSPRLALPSTVPNNQNWNRRVISPADMQATRAHGLCFFCDKKYAPGHKCVLPKQLYVMELEFPLKEEPGGEVSSEPVSDVPLVNEEWVPAGDTPVIYFCALSRLEGAQTIHVVGYNDKRPI